MKKILLGLSLVGALSLGGCQEEVGFNTEGLVEYDAVNLFDSPRGVKNGTISEDVYSSIVLTNLHHNTYLNTLSEYDIESETLGKAKAEFVVEISDNMREEVLSLSPISWTEDDEKITVKINEYIDALNSEADNISRYVQHRDELNLDKAKKYHKEAMKLAQEINKLVVKYDLE